MCRIQITSFVYNCNGLIIKHIVLIADMVRSREIDERSGLQAELEGLLGKLSLGNDSIVSPYTITIGDEFQAVFGSADNLFYDVFSILAALHPVQVRFSFGIDEITTRINNRQALGMDGEAFYNAREGMEKLKESGSLFGISGLTPPYPDLVNNMLLLVSGLIGEWRNNNRHFILSYLYENIKVSSMAERLGISEQAVYKNINSGQLDKIKSVFDNMCKAINKELL